MKIAFDDDLIFSSFPLYSTRVSFNLDIIRLKSIERLSEKKMLYAMTLRI